jgi:hypothetical protein
VRRHPVGPRILALWAVPRSRSTAFFRMMCERGDFQVLHEPFSYLAEFGEAVVGGTPRRSEREVIAAIRGMAGAGPVFFKDTTDERYPAVLCDRRFLIEDATHTFIIRHPAETIPSYYAVNPLVQRHQIGFERQYELFEAARQSAGETPIVIDADDLVAHPRRIVQAYCDRVGIRYLPNSLRWRPGPRPEWRPSERWHAEVSASSGFHSGQRPTVDVRGHPILGDYLAHHYPFYEKLRAHRLPPAARTDIRSMAH